MYNLEPTKQFSKALKKLSGSEQQTVANKLNILVDNPICLAGLPTTSAWGGTSLMTTAPAPTIAYSPIVTPQTIVALAPFDAPLLTTVSVISQSVLKARGNMSFVNVIDGPKNTSSSMVTP